MSVRKFLTVVIPTYNRASVVPDAIDSALSEFDTLPGVEIVIVDDHSTDGTLDLVSSRYAKRILKGSVRLVSLPTNRGATAAKNEGARNAFGEWLAFLDSDDLFIQGVGSQIIETLNRISMKCPIVFFGSRGEEDRDIENKQVSSRELSLHEYLEKGTSGECLPLIRRLHFLQYPYDEDLRGFEGLAYASLIKAIGPALLSQYVVRIYRTKFTDRISSPSGTKARALQLSKGNIRLLKRMIGEVTLKQAFTLLVKATYYFALHVMSRLRINF